MDISLIGPLIVLALIDSTSFGTLLIPIWMMLAPGGLRPKRLLIFLGTVAFSYLLLGAALTSGATVLLDEIEPIVESKPFQIVQLIVGAALLTFAILKGRKVGGKHQEPGRLLRWRERSMTKEGSTKGLIGLALVAVGLEVATMLPYLAAIGLLTTSTLIWPQKIIVLIGYCFVMILPALVLLIIRMRTARVVQPVLEKINAWMVRNAAETTAWIVGIVGFMCLHDAAQNLEIIGSISKSS